MFRVARCTLAAALSILAFAGCRDSAGPPSMRPTLSRKKDVAAALEPRLVLPYDTDPKIDLWLDAHLVWLDPAAHSNHKLFVFFGGANSTPFDSDSVAAEAARLGYHVVVLMYPNSKGVGVCKSTDPVGCQESFRMELLDGTDQSGFVEVSEANSMYNRLTKLLQYLHKKAPQEGWGQFLEAGAPKWHRIAIAGFSLGGGQAALIAKLHRVDRVVLLAAPLDGFIGKLGEWIPGWVATDATPAERYFALVHDRDPNALAANNNWIALGLDAFGKSVLQEKSEPPYGGTHRLRTNLPPETTCPTLSTGVHRSVAEDRCTPLDLVSGTPALSKAWIYLMTASPWRAPTDSDDDSDSSDDGNGDTSPSGR